MAGPLLGLGEQALGALQQKTRCRRQAPSLVRMAGSSTSRMRSCGALGASPSRCAADRSGRGAAAALQLGLGADAAVDAARS